MSRTDIHRYLRHGTLPQLRLFEATARLGSFARAAEELHLAPPTASVQFKKLTETVGVPLFDHVGKQLHLTEAGRRLYESCQEVFGAFASFEQSLNAIRSPESGRLRIAVSTAAMSLAPRLLGAFVARYPRIDATIESHNRRQLIDGIARDDDDVWLFAEPPDLETVFAQELVPNPLVVLARDDHPLAKTRSIPFARLAEEPLLVREEGSGTRRTALRLFAEAGVSPKIRMELGSNEAIREAILAGLGIAIMPRHTFGLDPESSRYRCLDVAGFPRENHWYLAYPRGKQLSPTARAFLDFARAEGRGLAMESLQQR